MNRSNQHPSPFNSRALTLWTWAALGIFWALVCALLVDGIAPFDNWVYGWVSACIRPALTGIVVPLTHLGGDKVLITAAVVVALLFLVRKRWQLSYLVVLNLPLASLVNTGLKYLFIRTRPDVLRLVEIGGYSFPSGHSFVSMSFYGLLIALAAALLPRKIRLWVCIPLGLLIAAIGLSRIYLGVHYASDVLAGFCGGFVFLTAYLRIAKRLWPKLPLF